MRIVTSKEMIDIEQTAIREFGIPVSSLMERAGLAVAEATGDLLGKQAVANGARVHILCGKGNNGGDGLVAARILANEGARVRVFLIEREQDLGPGATTFLRSVKLMGIPVHFVSDGDFKKLEYTLLTADAIVDAMLGTGIRGALRSHYVKAVQAINAVERRVVAVDVPTGVSADTGAVIEAVQADITVTFGRPKLGLLLEPGCRFSGHIRVADIGIPQSLFEENGKSVRTWIGRAWASEKLIKRPPDGHKWNFGRAVIVAGSVGMAGAAVLALKGALRSGAGLATWMGPADMIDTIQRAVPEATAVALPLVDGEWTPQAIDRVQNEIRDGDVLAVGPGLGRHPSVAAAVATMVNQLGVPTVVDADGLNALAALDDEARKKLNPKGTLVMTPHIKEAARLLGWNPHDVKSKRLEALQHLVDRWNAIVVLKGKPTLIQDPTGKIGLNMSGDVSLATGGTGDVLTGVIAGLMAGGHSPWDAVALAVYLHGRAGQLAGEEKSSYATVASDVVDMLPEAFLELKHE